jgi:hypothetical protein
MITRADMLFCYVLGIVGKQFKSSGAVGGTAQAGKNSSTRNVLSSQELR